MKKKATARPFKWQPFSTKQRKLLTWWMKPSPYSEHDIVIADGSIRAGKTVAQVDSYLSWSLNEFEGQNFIIAGKSMGALKRNVLEPMFKILSAKGINYLHHKSETPHVKIGSNTYYLFGASNEASQDTLQGLEAAGAYADEAALFPRTFIEQMIGRCDKENSKIFLNCNPQGPYHYLKTEYIDMAEDKRILRLHFNLNDNLALPEKTKERFRRMFTGLFYKRYILGQWVMAEGVVYDMFDESVHKVRTQDREYSEYYVACDYGTQNPTVFGLWGKCENTWYRIKEYHYSGRDKGVQKTDEEYEKDLKKFVGNRGITGLIVDPSATSFIALCKKRGWKVIKAKNDVLEGIRNVATALNQRKILFNDCNKQAFKEFSSYVWDEKAAERGEDKPVEKNDHHVDEIRYFVNTILMNRSGISFLK